MVFLPLGCNQIGDIGAIVFSEALLKNNILTILNLCKIETFLGFLGDNKIGAEGAKYLSQALAQNKILITLCLGMQFDIGV